MPRTTHGMASMYNKTYRTWQHIRQRCYNPNATGYENYGGRGITACERWASFQNFLEDMGEAPFKEATIDRIDNDKEYSKENCKWSTKAEQSRNRRPNIFVIVDGEQALLADAMRWFKIMPHGLYHRLHKFDETYQEAVDHYVRLRRGS